MKDFHLQRQDQFWAHITRHVLMKFYWLFLPGVAQVCVWILVGRSKYLGTSWAFFRHWWDKDSTREFKTVLETTFEHCFQKDWFLSSYQLKHDCRMPWEPLPQLWHRNDCRLSAWVQKVSGLARISKYREDKFLSVTRYELKEKKKQVTNFNGVTLDLHYYAETRNWLIVCRYIYE